MSKQEPLCTDGMLRIKDPKNAKLLACPCCKGAAQWRPNPPVRHMPHAIWCAVCHLSTAFYRLQAMAVRAWNRRDGKEA